MMDGNVFKLWTTLEDKAELSSESEDELDQLSRGAIPPSFASPTQQGNLSGLSKLISILFSYICLIHPTAEPRCMEFTKN